MAALTTLVGALTEPMIPALLKTLLDQGFGKGDIDLWKVPVALLALFGVRGAAGFVAQYALSYTASLGLLNLRRAMFVRLNDAQMGLFAQQSASKLSNTLVYEVQTGSSMLVNALLGLTKDSLTLLALLGYLLYLNWKLTLIVVFLFPALVVVMRVLSRRLYKLTRSSQQATDELAYVVEENVAVMAGITDLVLCGTARPASFFAYPAKVSLPEPAGCRVLDLCRAEMDYDWALQQLAAMLGADAAVARQTLALPPLPSGPISLDAVGQAIAVLLPEDAVVVDEAVTSSRFIAGPSLSARGHDWLAVTGGAIGYGLPAAVGAAVACPDRKVVALEGDGSAMYTLQSLWTMAREGLDVTVVIFSNRGYQILRGELANVGVTEVGRNAVRMFDVVEPGLDWVALAKGHGVQGVRVTDMAQFNAAFAQAMSERGPRLIEVIC